MTEIEKRKINIAKEFIKEKVLNKELVEVQWSILWELNSLKKEIESIKNIGSDILWSEKPVSQEETQWDNKIFWLDNIMKILFNEKWNQRTKFWYEAKKMVNVMYLMISDEWKKNLDLLYESLQKSKTEEELRQSLSSELKQLQNNISSNTNPNESNNISNNVSVLWDLTSQENQEMQDLVEKSQNINNINYLENNTYKKYLNIIERDLNLPKYTLECVCYQESMWKLYSNWHIIWSSAWAQWLFQFMPDTANSYMKKDMLKEKYWKTFTSKDDFLKDPLASAWAAWIMYSEFMNKYNYNLQTSLACYNRWIWNYQNKIWNKNITAWDLSKLPNETKKYIENITKNLLEHNSVSSNNIFADLWKYTWSKESINHNDILIWPELLATKKEEIWWLWNSIMTGFQWYYDKTTFPNMDWIEWKSTQNHPNRFKSKQDVIDYKNNHPDIKSFMFYFWANTRDNNQTLKDIKQRSEWMEQVWIQPVLCTCIWEDNHTRLAELNGKIRQVWKEKNRPVMDFAKEYNNWQIAMWNNQHPTGEWYTTMSKLITECMC